MLAGYRASSVSVSDIRRRTQRAIPFVSRFENIEEPLGLFPEKEYPFSIGLGDLDIVTQILGTPAKLLHYTLCFCVNIGPPPEVSAKEIDGERFLISPSPKRLGLSLGFRMNLNPCLAIETYSKRQMRHAKMKFCLIPELPFWNIYWHYGFEWLGSSSAPLSALKGGCVVNGQG